MFWNLVGTVHYLIPADDSDVVHSDAGEESDDHNIYTTDRYLPCVGPLIIVYGCSTLVLSSCLLSRVYDLDLRFARVVTYCRCRYLGSRCVAAECFYDRPPPKPSIT